jgi:hypothetical protein
MEDHVSPRETHLGKGERYLSDADLSATIHKISKLVDKHQGFIEPKGLFYQTVSILREAVCMEFIRRSQLNFWPNETEICWIPLKWDFSEGMYPAWDFINLNRDFHDDNHSIIYKPHDGDDKLTRRDQILGMIFHPLLGYPDYKYTKRDLFSKIYGHDSWALFPDYPSWFWPGISATCLVIRRSDLDLPVDRVMKDYNVL